MERKWGLQSRRGNHEVSVYLALSARADTRGQARIWTAGKSDWSREWRHWKLRLLRCIYGTIRCVPRAHVKRGKGQGNKGRGALPNWMYNYGWLSIRPVDTADNTSQVICMTKTASGSTFSGRTTPSPLSPPPLLVVSICYGGNLCTYVKHNSQVITQKNMQSKYIKTT